MNRTRYRTRGLMTLLAASFAACQGDRPAPENNDHPLNVAAPARSTLSALAAARGGYVSSFDQRGVPKFIWAVGQVPAEPADNPRTAAQHHLARFGSAHGLKASDLEAARVQVRALGNKGYLAKFDQRVGGVQVYPSSAALLMRPNYDLVAISGSLQQTSIAKGESFALGYANALAIALHDMLGFPVNAEQLIDLQDQRGDYKHFKLAAGVQDLALGDNQVKRIYYAENGALQAAYFAELYAGQQDDVDSEAYQYIVSARDGSVLRKRNLVADDAFDYRVWADAAGNHRPFDGPISNWSPHPTGIRDGSLPNLIPPVLITMEGFNTNAGGAVDPWLDAAATETSGNNIDAYSDHDLPDGYSNGDLRATLTGVNEFDRVFDTAADPVRDEDQVMASVTNLFYVTNWLHDYFYDSGFDELAGNAQRDNYGRGGEDRDALHAEAQDNVLRGNRNNANMSTPSDGLSPRMQMYSWTGLETVTLTLTPGGVVPAGTAAFGPRDFNVTGQITAANDGVGNGNDGCTAIPNVAGRIALIDRGTCAFTVKVANAQAGGAVAVIIANNAPSTNPPGLGGVDPTITIGVLSVLQSTGQAIRASLLNGPVSATLLRNVSVDRDGSLDYTVVAHEWGHYFHHRLADCGTHQCRAMSEGWGDYTSLFMMLRPGDPLDGVYPTAVYASLAFPDGGYFGIRRLPYSTNFAVNPLTFQHVADGNALPNIPLGFGGVANSEVHNAGEIWSSVMFETYVALQRESQGSTTAESFDDVSRRMADYAVLGLQMTPREATFTEARDGILAAVSLLNRSEVGIAAAAFAARGMGSCAQSPSDPDSPDFSGVVEGYDVRPNAFVTRVQFDESLRSCDNDGFLDADERGRLLIDVANASASALNGATLTVSSTSAGITFPAGAVFQVGAVDPFATKSIELEIAVDASLTSRSTLALAVSLQSPTGCQTTQTSTVISRINFDSVTGARSDDVESDNTPWVASGDFSDIVWRRAAITALDHAWHGEDLGTAPSDTNLTSPALSVSPTDPFVISFDHRYSFEFSGGISWDGGVIELSTNDGQTWQDLSTWITDTGYGDALTDTSGNPLALRVAFTGTSSTWPARNHVVYDFGTALANQQVRVRFRIGTDANTGDYGWEIDNLTFDGITNAPFQVLVDDPAVCPAALIADAGADQTVDPGQVVGLNGGNSRSWQGLPFTYSWAQSAGPAVTMLAADTANPVFAAPRVGAATTVTFVLTVDDGTRTATDAVDIFVREGPPLMAAAGADQTVEARAVVVLDGTASQSGGLPLTYTWTQSTGTPVTISNGSSAIARFEAPALVADETLTFQLEISDGTRSAVDTLDVLVHAVGPLAADAGADQAVEQGAAVALDGSRSRSLTNLPLTYQWAQTAGAAVQVDNATSPIASFTAPDSAGTLSFTLTVSDGTRTATDSVDVVVRARANTVTADAGVDQVAEAGVTIVLDASGSRSGANKPLTYAWTQVDGRATVNIANASGVAATFVAPAVDLSSTLVFQVEVSDGEQSATDTVAVRVRPVVIPKKDDGCSCSTSQEGGAESALGALLLGAALFIRRRRRV